MLVLQANNIELSFGEHKVLDNINTTLSLKQKLGVVGVNGSGKTTLLKILTGQITPDKGTVLTSKTLKIGFLEQELSIPESLTIYQAVLQSYQYLVDMESQLRQLEVSLSDSTYNCNQSELINLYDSLSHEFKENGGFEYHSRAKGILKGLGFDESSFDKKLSTLSGGQKTRLLMARLLSKEPDILFLDEPTNHLDINSLSWLENFLSDYSKSAVIVSHDRYFLDKVCNKILEIEHSNGTNYDGNYSYFINKKRDDREFQERLYNNQQKEIKRMEQIIAKQKQFNRERNIIAAESRQKAIDRMEKVDAPSKDVHKIKLDFKISVTSGNDVMTVENLSSGYGNKIIFNNFTFSVKKNEKIFILGPNGCGKSTLLKTLASKIIPTSGEIKLGQNVKMSYYDQALIGLNYTNTIYDELLTLNIPLSQTIIRNTLSLFGFKGDDVFKEISLLSGGEKSRVLLSKLILSQPNLVLLDEPTNHLDISSKEVLENSLSEYEGTILCVSHDRYFIKKLASRVLFFDNEILLDYHGDYESFLQFYNSRQQNSDSNQDSTNVSKSKNSFIVAKEEKSKVKKLQKQIETTNIKIKETEDRIEKIDCLLVDEQISTDHVKLQELFEEKETLEYNLLELYEKLDALNESLGLR